MRSKKTRITNFILCFCWLLAFEITAVLAPVLSIFELKIPVREWLVSIMIPVHVPVLLLWLVITYMVTSKTLGEI